MGYHILAVEPCLNMLDQLTSKEGASSVRTFNGKMQDFQSDTPFDMAICVFTVLLYLLARESFNKSVKAAAKAIRPGGLLLIDIPSKAIFQNHHSSTHLVERSVTVSPSKNDIYLYSEDITMKQPGRVDSYSDRFQIKYWKVDDVLGVLSDNNFQIEKDMSDDFAGSGSRYLLMKKKEMATTFL